jgi:hypothetical protein
MFALHTKNVKEPITLRDLPTMRQAFVVASTLITAGVMLSIAVNQYFILLTLLVAGGLMFSGLVGMCPMVLILQKMPWNRKKQKCTSTERSVGVETD